MHSEIHCIIMLLKREMSPVCMCIAYVFCMPNTMQVCILIKIATYTETINAYCTVMSD